MNFETVKKETFFSGLFNAGIKFFHVLGRYQVRISEKAPTIVPEIFLLFLSVTPSEFCNIIYKYITIGSFYIVITIHNHTPNPLTLYNLHS
jgi:hypothetical protein